MENSRWERYGALGGVVFVVLDVIVAVLGGEPPAMDAGQAEIAGYFADKGPALEAGLWLFGIVINLLTIPAYFDIALRDFGLALGAFALARLSVDYSEV